MVPCGRVTHAGAGSLGGVIPGIFVRPLRGISPLTITPVATVIIHFFRFGYIARFLSEASFQFPFVATGLIALALANARFQNFLAFDQHVGHEVQELEKFTRYR